MITCDLIMVGEASLGEMPKSLPPSRVWRQAALQWVMTSDSETRQHAFRSPDGCGVLTFRMILFLMENRVSFLGKNRIWRSEWPSICHHPPGAVLASGVGKRDRTHLISKGFLVSKRNLRIHGKQGLFTHGKYGELMRSLH